jgi:predicted DCC family thiol-disulfide oxidoreductase YuxK
VIAVDGSSKNFFFEKKQQKTFANLPPGDGATGPPDRRCPAHAAMSRGTPASETGATAMESRPKVYYDGGCPVCAREISFYQARPGGESLLWVDITQAEDAAFGPGLSREAALARMHVRRADGTLVEGAAAFAEIWRAMPGMRWLGRLAALPPFNVLAALGYRLFLRARKRWR